jgi:hypothetical protein
MAATPISGVTGSVTLPTGHNARIRAWSATLSQSVNDATGFSQARWATNLGGIASLSGSASGYLEFDATTTTPGIVDTGAPAMDVTTAAGSMILVAGTGCSLTFSGIISSISLGQSVDGVGTVAFSFVSSGAITETWDQSA